MKTLTKPSNLTEGFRNHLTDYSTQSATANILWMFFKCILFLGRQQSKYSITLYSKTDMSMEEQDYDEGR